MRYSYTAVHDDQIPRAVTREFQHAVDTYASETNKVISTWREFAEDQLGYRPHPRSASVAEIMKHQLLSERRFFAEFIGCHEPPPAEVVPATITLHAFVDRMRELAVPRLAFLAAQPQAWWLETVPFFDVRRERAWIFWRRVLHTAHHRTQLTVYLRLLDHKVPPTYGPTADVTWTGADPTTSADAAGRR